MNDSSTDRSTRTDPQTRNTKHGTRVTNYGLRVTGAFIALAFLCLATALTGRAAGAAETRAYDVARNIFYSGAYELAEREFGEFVKTHPDSDRVPEAVLLQAQCRYQQGKADEALALLRERLAAAGKLVDEYRFWIAESLFRKGSYSEAAGAFAQVLAEFPAAARRLDASLGEAYARFKMGELARTVELLSQPKGAFALAAQNRPDDELTVRGRLLLAEACLGLKDYAKGEEVLVKLAERNLRPDLNWQRLYLLARIQSEAQRPDAALETVTNLVTQLAAATNALSLSLQADAAALQGEIFEHRGQTELAIQAYERNLGTNAPVARRHQAIQQTVQWTLAQNKVGDAARRLEAFAARYPSDPMLDLLRMTVGELRLRELRELADEPRRGATNLLQQARTQFEQVIANGSTQWVARSQLDRGWCLWEEGRLRQDNARFGDGLLAFQAAAQLLPRSDQQAVARFKLADCQFVLTNYSSAITNYWIVATNYSDIPTVQTQLVGQACYQIVRAAIELGDLAGAESAVQRILADFPPGDLNDRSLLLYGQALGRLSSPDRAREFFAGFTNRFPQSALLPEVELAIGRTYEQEGRWSDAAGLYDGWIERHPEHPSRPGVEFERAWAADLAGNQTNALALFTQFVAKYPGHPLAPQAQYWVGGYYFGLGGTNYDRGEENFQKVYQNPNWPQSELSFRARMMAGRAAFARQGYNDAAAYFTNLIAELGKWNPASTLLPQAYYALADTYVRSPGLVPGSTNVIDSYKDAIVVLGRIPREFPNDPLVPLAWGQMGAYYAQLAGLTHDPKDNERALNAYATAASTNSTADPACRAMAETGLARVIEKQAEEASGTDRANLLKDALRHYVYVAEGKNLRPTEQADPFWVKEAAVAAARLAEELQQWEVADTWYQRLLTLSPPLRKTWELKLQRLSQLRAQADQTKN